jgi:methylglutaconyl-CoA hydratase
VPRELLDRRPRLGVLRKRRVELGRHRHLARLVVAVDLDPDALPAPLELGLEALRPHRANRTLRHVSALRVERDGEILRVTLARPEQRNAFDAALISELAEAFVDVGRVRAVVLAGEGPSFSAGADVEWMRASVELSHEENVADALAFRRVLEGIDRCPAPVVARVHGHALGGGSGVVACADIAVAAEGTVFGFSEVKLGIVPAMISPFVLAKIGPSAARRYFLTGERFDAATALRIGLVHEVAADVDAAVDRVVGDLLSAGPLAVRAAKRLVLDAPLDGPETARRIAERRTSTEGQEGLRAFGEGRRPSWSE